MYWPGNLDVLQAERDVKVRFYLSLVLFFIRMYAFVKDGIEVCKLSDSSASEDECSFVVDNTLTSYKTSG